MEVVVGGGKAPLPGLGRKLAVVDGRSEGQVVKRL